MKDFRFYAEHASKADKRKRKHSGNVIAVHTDLAPFIDGSGRACREAVTGVYDRPDSPVCGSAVGLDYLRTRCRRISEAEARKIHPEMFNYLADWPTD